MTDVAQAYVRLRPNLTGFQKDAEAQISGVGHKLGSVFAVAFGATAGVGLAKHAVDAATAQQQALSQVQQLTKQAGAQNEAYGKTIKENLIDLADRSGFTVEELAQAFARLQPSVKDTGKTLDLLSSATETARGRGQDLTTVSTALAKVQAGQTSGLTRLGILTKAYTQGQDDVRARLLQVTHAETALAQSRDKRYSGTIKLTPAEIALTKQTDAQRSALVESLKAQLDSAKATDKRTTAEQALAELQARYAGQNPIFAATAQGQVARFHEAVNELEVSIGQALLPGLASAAEAGRNWARELTDSGKGAAVVEQAMQGVGDAARAIGVAFNASRPALQLFVKATEEIGSGPILFATAAYYGLVKAQALATVVGGKFDKLVASGNAIMLERAAAEEAVIVAERQRAVSAALAAVSTEADAFAAQVAAFGLGEVAVANTAAAASMEVATVAAVEETVALGGLRAASIGMLGVLTGPTAIVAGVAALAGGLYYLSTRSSETEQTVNSLTSALERQTEAESAAREARSNAQIDTNALPGLRDSRAQALDDLNKAQERYDRLALSGHATRDQLAKDANLIAIAQARWRDANRQVVSTEHDKVEQLKKSTQATHDTRAALEEAVRSALKLAPAQQQNNFKPNPLGVAQVKAAYDELNQAADDSSKHITEKQRQQLRDLADRIQELGRRPTQVEIELILNTDKAREQLAGFKGSLLDAGPLGGLAPLPSARGARADVVVQGDGAQRRRKIADEAKKDATTYSTQFVQTIDAGTIRQALVDAITSAQSNLSSLGSGLASAIGATLDARLKRSTDRLDEAAKAVQTRIAQREAAATARSTQQQQADAALKLKELQDVLGPGALTADQANQLQQAKNAVLDAQDAILNATDQGKVNQIENRKALLAQQNDLEKTAASRRIADLTDELNRGLITQATYVKGVRGLLDKEQVSYKTSGQLLGKAFADGFADSLSSIIAQAKALGLVGRAGLQAAPKGTKAVSPVGAEAAAIQAFIDQVAGSGGRFNVKNADQLPKGVKIGELLSAAGQQRAESSYRQKSTQQQDDVIHYTGQVADHTKAILDELKKAKPAVVVVPDNKAAKRKHAQAGATR